MVIAASPWGKSKTLVTLIAIAATLLQPDSSLTWWGTLTWWLLFVATVLTIISAVDYVGKAWQANVPRAA